MAMFLSILLTFIVLEWVFSIVLHLLPDVRQNRSERTGGIAGNGAFEVHLLENISMTVKRFSCLVHVLNKSPVSTSWRFNQSFTMGVCLGQCLHFRVPILSISRIDQICNWLSAFTTPHIFR